MECSAGASVSAGVSVSGHAKRGPGVICVQEKVFSPQNLTLKIGDQIDTRTSFCALDVLVALKSTAWRK